MRENGKPKALLRLCDSGHGCAGQADKRTPLPLLWLAISLFAGAAGAAGADKLPSSELRVEWAGNNPRIQLTVRAQKVSAGVRELTVPLAMTGAGGQTHWTGSIKMQLNVDGVGQGQADARLPAKADAPYCVKANIGYPALGVEVSERVSFSGPADQVSQHGVRVMGRYPEARVELLLRLKSSDQVLGIEAIVRDRERNQILRKSERHLPGNDGQLVRIDLTPPPRAVGPFSVEYQVANETGTFNLRHEQRFPYANAVIPLTSMQSDRLIDWYRSTLPSPESFGMSGNYTGTPFNNRDNVEPALFDDGVFHAGGRSLRLQYAAGRTTHVYSNLELPGYPIRAYVWVKGNKSGDRLVATFRDRCEIGRKPWERHVNKNSPFVCVLDFDDWRRFEMPILGEGLQGDSRDDRKDALVIPVYMLAFSVESARPKTNEAPERVVWIDDLAVESQVPMAERVSLELRADTPDAQLRSDGKIFAAIGNGAGVQLTDGRLHVSARDRGGNDVFETTKTVEAASDAFVLVEIPMSRLAEVRPDGPVTVDATFTAPSAGLRIRRSLVLKASRHAAVFWDFEDQQCYNRLSAAEGKPAVVGARPVAGGAEGTRQALAIAVPTNAVNMLILHPTLPGVPTRIEMLVKGGPVPVKLRPQFFDAGRTGVGDMSYNRLLTPEILVDWQDWRRIVAIAPAIPVGYDDTAKQLVFEATYPLNLLLAARVEGGTPGEILVDRISVYTHIDDTNAVAVSPVYADEKEIIQPDSPLALRVQNWHATARKQVFDLRLTDIHGQTVLTESRTLALPPGQTVIDTLVPCLPRGVYTLEVESPGLKSVREKIFSVDLAEYFGEKPETLLTDLPALERQVGMATRRIYLDWDNLELGPGMFRYNWFNNELAKAADKGKYKVVSILGFSADWAGPEKQDAVQKNMYERFIGNHMQVPVRMTDWNIYVREAVREFAGRIAAWEFWENPDFRGSPAYIPPERYRAMLAVVRQWVDLYDPGTPLIAAGFSAENIYDYLQNIPDAHTLPFDRVGIHFNIGELSPESADMEGLFADLNGLLKLDERKRSIDVPQLDWAVGEMVSPLQQAAYHSRAALIMHKSIRDLYRMKLVNDGEEFEGYGIFHRRPFGNTPNIQGLRPCYAPKPSYFAIATTRRMLEKSRFDAALRIPDGNATANYAYLYEKEGGLWMTALWRARGEPRAYRVPAGWKGATIVDAFGASVPMRASVRLGPVPLFVTFPADRAAGQIRHDLRLLEPDDGRDRLALALVAFEPDSAGSAGYRASGSGATVVRRDRRLIGGEPVEHAFLTGLTAESFVFAADKPGTYKLTRTWSCPEGETNFNLSVSLNGGPAQEWDLSFSETGRNLKQVGVRESSLLLLAVTSGVNRVAVSHVRPGNSACWTVAPVPDDAIDLASWEPINAMQPKGYPLASLSARGTPLRIGDRTYATGVGTLSPSYIEYPLQKRFARLEVTVGIDAVSRGRGNVVFSIYGDGKLLKSSGTVTGFSPAQKLIVEDLGNVSRLALRVVNTEKDDAEGLADWVDARLYLKGGGQ